MLRLFVILLLLSTFGSAQQADSAASSAAPQPARDLNEAGAAEQVYLCAWYS